MKTKLFFVDENVKLAYFEAPVQGAKIGVVILHGLAEHKGRYEDFIKKLNNAGISVFTFDLRGHGESSGRRGDIESFDDYVSDLDLFIRFIKKKYPKMKIALFGHSLGGLVVSAYVENGGAADMLVLSSPSLAIGKLMKFLGYIPNKILGKIYIKKRHSESAEMLKYSRSDPLACKSFTLRLLKESFAVGIHCVVKNLEKIKIPVLMLGGKQDPLVKSGKFSKLLKKFGGKDKKLIIYDDAKHRIVQNAAKDKSIPDIIKWLKTIK